MIDPTPILLKKRVKLKMPVRIWIHLENVSGQVEELEIAVELKKLAKVLEDHNVKTPEHLEYLFELWGEE